MFKVSYDFITPDFLYEEELSVHHSGLKDAGLRVLSLNSEHIKYSITLGGLYSGNSMNDLFSLALAKQEKCSLITGDYKLRQASELEDVDVFGTLWLVEELFKEKILNYGQCQTAYEKMRTSNRKLPWAKVEEQLKRFKASLTVESQHYPTVLLP